MRSNAPIQLQVKIIFLSLTCVKAFHEKAGRSQGNSGFIVSCCSLSQRKVFLPPSHCRHASIRTLEERSVFARCMWGVLNSAGAAICLATSRCTQEWNVAQAINAVTGTRLWLCRFSSWNDFDFVFAFCLRGCRHRQSAAIVQWLVYFCVTHR